MALKIYKQIVLPGIDYGDFVIDGATEGEAGHLQTIQNHFLRCILRVKNPLDKSRALLHKESGCNWLHERRRKSLLNLMYVYSRDSENVVKPVRVLRGNDKVKLVVRRAHGDLYARSPLYRGRGLWDKLDGKVQKAKDKLTFNNKL